MQEKRTWNKQQWAPWQDVRNHTNELRPALWKTQLLSSHSFHRMFGGSRSKVFTLLNTSHTATENHTAHSSQAL